MKLLPYIDKYLLNRPDDIRKTDCFHPSELSKCPRHIYDSYLGLNLVQEKDSVLERIFDNGKSVHTRIQDYLTTVGVLLRAEVEIYDDINNICGSADGVIQLNDSLGVVEIKSINLNQFIALFSPKQSHVEQINIYMYCLMLCYPFDESLLFKSNQFKNFEWGIILYECKDNQHMKEFFVPYDQSIVDKILNKIDYVKSCIKSNQIPSRVTHEDCRWCKTADCF